MMVVMELAAEANHLSPNAFNTDHPRERQIRLSTVRPWRGGPYTGAVDLAASPSKLIVFRNVSLRGGWVDLTSGRPG